MYNLLVTAAEGTWEKRGYEYDRSRFLEYTNDKIAATFKDLNESHIEALKALPCLFAYEGFEGNVRIGWLTNIKERGRSILIEYKFHPGIEEIPYENLEPISTLLDIRQWEMNRTHWAIKDEDLFDRLKSASLISKNIGEGAAKVTLKSRSSEPRAPTSRVSTVQGFIGKVLSHKKQKL